MVFKKGRLRSKGLSENTQTYLLYIRSPTHRYKVVLNGLFFIFCRRAVDMRRPLTIRMPIGNCQDTVPSTRLYQI